jgi:hypothetical protein
MRFRPSWLTFLNVLIYPSFFRILVISSFNFEVGMSTLSKCARLAFRIFVSISATGSDRLMTITPYQLDFVTPGSFPSLASVRKQMRHSLNFRIYPLCRPQTLQRCVLRVKYFCARSDFSIAAFLAISLSAPVLRGIPADSLIS